MNAINMQRIHGTFESLEVPHTNFVRAIVAMDLVVYRLTSILGTALLILTQLQRGYRSNEACVRGTCILWVIVGIF